MDQENWLIFLQCHHMSLMDFMVSPSGCGRNVTDFWVWDAHEAQLRCPMRWMVINEYERPGGALNLSYTKLPRPWSPWESSLSRKNPHDRAGNRTRDLIISSQKLWPLDHEAGQNWLILGKQCFERTASDNVLRARRLRPCYDTVFKLLSCLQFR
jgi:hypothetical protein